MCPVATEALINKNLNLKKKKILSLDIVDGLFTLDQILQ